MRQLNNRNLPYINFTTNKNYSPNRIGRLIPHKRVLQVVDVVPVARGTQIVVRAVRTVEPYSGDARLRAAVADYVRMFDPDLGVIHHDQIVLLLVANAVVGPMARVPVHDDGLLRRVGRPGSTYFTQRSDVSFTVIWRIGGEKKTKSRLVKLHFTRPQQELKSDSFI